MDARLEQLIKDARSDGSCSLRAAAAIDEHHDQPAAAIRRVARREPRLAAAATRARSDRSAGIGKIDDY